MLVASCRSLYKGKVRQRERKTNKSLRRLQAVSLPLKARCVWGQSRRQREREREGETGPEIETNGAKRERDFFSPGLCESYGLYI